MGDLTTTADASLTFQLSYYEKSLDLMVPLTFYSYDNAFEIKLNTIDYTDNSVLLSIKVIEDERTFSSRNVSLTVTPLSATDTYTSFLE